MQALIDIDEEQLNKLLFYTHSESVTEAVTKAVQDYLFKFDESSRQEGHNIALKKQLLEKMQSRFSVVPEQTSLADELIAERRIDGLKE